MTITFDILEAACEQGTFGLVWFNSLLAVALFTVALVACICLDLHVDPVIPMSITAQAFVAVIPVSAVFRSIASCNCDMASRDRLGLILCLTMPVVVPGLSLAGLCVHVGTHCDESYMMAKWFLGFTSLLVGGSALVLTGVIVAFLPGLRSADRLRVALLFPLGAALFLLLAVINGTLRLEFALMVLVCSLAPWLAPRVMPSEARHIRRSVLLFEMFLALTLINLYQNALPWTVVLLPLMLTVVVLAFTLNALVLRWDPHWLYRIGILPRRLWNPDELAEPRRKQLNALTEYHLVERHMKCDLPDVLAAFREAFGFLDSEQRQNIEEQLELRFGYLSRGIYFDD